MATTRKTEPAGLVSLADEERVKEILATTVLDLWKAVNTLTRLRPSRRERYRVAIFGSARAKPGTFVYDEVKMWKGLVDWASATMLDPQLALANPEDLQIPQCLDTADEAIAVVRELHARWKAQHGV
jgi:hypothetical protein